VVQFLPGFITAILVYLSDYYLTILALQKGKSAIYLNEKLGVLMPVLGVFLFLGTLFLMRFRLNHHINVSSSWWKVSIASGLVLGGAISNILDYNIFNAVLDYWILWDTVWYNICDIAVTIGTVFWLHLLSKSNDIS
jgi:lipoprotein signal peptidase